LARGEQFDIVILADSALDNLAAQGKVEAGSRVDLARSMIGMSVRKGTPKPDISTVDALRQTLLDAKSVAYSASASGTYLANELFPRLGVAEHQYIGIGRKDVARTWNHGKSRRPHLPRNRPRHSRPRSYRPCRRPSCH
jgi:hypothetical protein